MSGPSSVALAVQQLGLRMERLSALMEDIQKLARGDVAHDLYTIATPTTDAPAGTYMTAPTHIPAHEASASTPATVTGATPTTSETKMLEVVPYVTENDVRLKLKDFNVEFDQLDTNLACVILSATISRLLERQSYEKIKLAKADSDKLANLARSTNAEVAEPAKIKRAEVLEQISKLSSQQQMAHARCREIVLENRFHYKNKAVEMENEFENFSTAVQWWYNLCLRIYLERIHQRAASAAEAVNFVRSDEQTQPYTEAARHGYSSVAGARNKIQIGKTVALSTAERAVADYVQTVHEERSRIASRAEAGLTTGSVDNSLAVGTSASTTDPSKPKDEASATTANESAFQMTMSQYMGSRTMTLTDTEAKLSVYAERFQQLVKAVSQAFPSGAHVHCLGRQGNVFYVGETPYGPGVWIGIRLIKPHGETLPLVYSTSHSVPIRCEHDLLARTSKCPVENALYAPYQVVSPFVQFEMKELKRGSTRVTYANRINRWSLRYLKQLRNSNLEVIDNHSRGPFAVVDSLARATPEAVTTSPIMLARYLSSTPVTVANVRIETTNSAYLFEDASSLKNTSALLRARAFYMWLCTHMTCERTPPRGPEEHPDVGEVLLTRSSDAEGIALLFRALCEASGIDCIVIRGVAKGVGGLAVVDAVDSRAFRSGKANHAWNAFRVAGHRWAIVDVAWGIGTWHGMRPKQVFSPAYFDPPAELAQLTHFPTEVLTGQRQFPELGQFRNEPFRVQFAAQPIAKYEFQTGPIITRSFVEYGLRLIYPHHQYEVEVDQPFVSFALLCPKNVDISVLVQSDPSSNLAMQTALSSGTGSSGLPKLRSAATSVMAVNSASNALTETTNRYSWRVSYESFAPSPDTHNVAIVLVALPTRGTRRICLCVQRRVTDTDSGAVYGLKAEVAAMFEVKNEIGLYNLRSNTTVVASNDQRLKHTAARAFASNNSSLLMALEANSGNGVINSAASSQAGGTQSADSYAGFLRNISGTQEGQDFTLVEPMRGYFELGTPLPVQIYCPSYVSRLFLVNGSRWVECSRVSSASTSGLSGFESEYGVDVLDYESKDHTSAQSAKLKEQNYFESSIILRDTPELAVLALDDRTKTFRPIYHFTAPYPAPPVGMSSVGTIVLDPSYRCFLFGLRVHSVIAHGRNTVVTLETTPGVCLHATVHAQWPLDRRRGISGHIEAQTQTTVKTASTSQSSQTTEAEARGLGQRVKNEVRVTPLRVNLQHVAYTLPPSQTTAATMAGLLSPPPATATSNTDATTSTPAGDAVANGAKTSSQWWQLSAEVPSAGQFTLQLFAAHSKTGLYRLVCDCLIYSAVESANVL